MNSLWPCRRVQPALVLGTLSSGPSLTPEPAQAAYAQVEKCCQERQAQKGAQDDASNGPGAQGGTWKRQSDEG